MAIDTVKVTVNGTTVTATNTSGNTYVATLAAPNVTSYNVNSEHYYPVTIVATNKAGTATTVNDKTASIGTSCRLRVKEITAPTIAISAPTGGQFLGTATPSINVNVTDAANGSGVSISTLKITVDDTTYINTASNCTVSTITNGYNIVCVPNALTDGAHTVKVQVTDNDGNTATSSTINFTTDTVAPTLSITNPNVDGTYVPKPNIFITGTTSDSTSGIPTINVTLNDEDQGLVTVSESDGTFTKDIILVEGSNTIVITATDKAGKVTTVTRTIILDSSQPVVAAVVINPNPVNVGETYTVTISVTEQGV